MWLTGWTLDSQDSIICDEHSIKYQGNVQGQYLLDGNEVWHQEYYSYYYRDYESYKKLLLNEDGSRQREYIPKSQEYLDQVKMTVQRAINDTLSEEEKEQYTDISIEITSEPDFEQFLKTDYSYYTASKEHYNDEAKKYAFLLLLYALVMVSFLIKLEDKQYIAKWIITIIGFGVMMFLCKEQLQMLTAIGCAIVLVYLDLRILTKNHFSRELFFTVSGIILGMIFNRFFMTSHFCFAAVCNVIMCVIFALNNQALFDQHAEKQSAVTQPEEF